MENDEPFGMSLLAYLAGPWRILRRIDDRRAGTVLHFEGDARFVPEGDTVLDHREDGTLDTGAGTVRASRRYRWHGEGAGARVTFADGRPFHRVAPRGGIATDIHDCPPDLYRVRYTFDTPDRWTATWRTRGPRKDYTLESTYTRLHRAGHPVHSPPC